MIVSEKGILDSAKSFITTLFANDYSGHDAEHSLRVYKNAIMIADTEPQCDHLVISLAALLHDADDHKIFNTKNNANARMFLEGQNLGKDIIEQICGVINGVSFSKNKGRSPETLEGKIVQDADRLDAIGAVGIARTFAYAGAHGRAIIDSMKHFDEKLLLLKDKMNTQEGKRIAQSRHDFLIAFVNEMKEEMNEGL